MLHDNAHMSSLIEPQAHITLSQQMNAAHKILSYACAYPAKLATMTRNMRKVITLYMHIAKVNSMKGIILA